MEYIRGNVRIEWDASGYEGLCGEYDPDDPEDIHLLRFYVSVSAGRKWHDLDDSSYCTLFPANVANDLKLKGLEFLMDEIYEPASLGYSVKKLCERLSWISPEWITKRT